MSIALSTARAESAGRPSAQTTLEDVAGAPALAAAWGALAERLQASPFLHPGFVLAWWAAFGVGQLVLATARRDGRLVAALPLVRRHGTLRSPANWHTPRTGVLAEDEEAAAALADAVLAAGQRRVTLSFLDAGDAGTRALRRAAQSAGYRVREQTLMRSPYLDMEGGSWEAFAEGLGSTRASLKKRRRRLEQAGAVTCEVSDGTADFERQFAEVLRIEGMGWKGERGTAIASRPDTQQFYRAIAEWAAERGWLRLHLMRVDGAPIAVALGLEAHGTYSSVKIGFDPAHRRGGPGVLLHEEMVRGGFARGLRRLELLGDEDEHKRTWSSATRELIELDAWAPSFTGHVGRIATTQIRPIASRFGLGRVIRAVRGTFSRGSR